jgi:hypothetical protein
VHRAEDSATSPHLSRGAASGGHPRGQPSGDQRPSRGAASGGHPRGQPSDARQAPHGDSESARSTSRVEPRSDHPSRDEHSPLRQATSDRQGGRAGAARQQPAPPPSGVHGPGDALAAARALLQFPPDAVGDAPRVNSWVARLADLVGFAHLHQEPAHARGSSRPPSMVVPEETRRGGARSGPLPAPRPRPREEGHGERQGEPRRAPREEAPRDHVSVGSSKTARGGVDLRNVLSDRQGEDARTRIERSRERHCRGEPEPG